MHANRKQERKFEESNGKGKTENGSNSKNSEFKIGLDLNFLVFVLAGRL